MVEYQYLFSELCCFGDVSRFKGRFSKKADYVKLPLVEIRKEHLNEEKELSDLKDIFCHENEQCPQLILITGGPGMGKTTLANEIGFQWAKEGGLLADEFDAVISIPLKLVQEERPFGTLLKQYIGEEEYQNVKKLAGKGCLLILEGLDEMPLNCRKNDETWKRLIEENTLLEHARILITSRPHACEELYEFVKRRIEVKGFGDEEIRKSVEYSFSNDDAKEFMSQLTEYPQLRSLCFVPLNLVMTIDIFLNFNQKKKLPSTLTELYQLFIVMILQREVVKGHCMKKLTVGDQVKGILCKMLAGISEEVVGILYLLCKLAYHAFFKSYSDMEENDWLGSVKRYKVPMIIFTESDLTKSGIEVTSEFDGFGLLKATHTHQLPIDIVTYNFFHLTVQEFLCSLYMSTLSEEEQLNLLSEHFSDYPNVMMFFCGLTGLATNEMFDFVDSIVTSSEASLLKDDPYFVTAVRCVYESNHSDPSKLPPPLSLDMSHSTLLPYDCLCLSWLLSCYPVSELKMYSCHIGDTGAKLLVRHYPNNNSTGQLLEVLDLSFNDFTITGLEHVKKIVKTSRTTLRVLNIGWNKIGDDGIMMISEELQHSNSLTKLSFESCELSVKGATAVSKLLKNNNTLEKLVVGYNTIGNDGLSMIVEQLYHITTLTVLNVSECGLSEEGATVISELLKDKNCMIQELNMSRNYIGDEGITAITTALTNSRIRVLGVAECGITLTGATSIATFLSVNNSIRMLGALCNHISKDGVHLILQSAMSNKVDIRIDHEQESSQVMMQLEEMWKNDHEIELTIREILEDWSKTNVSAVNNEACKEINDDYKSDGLATDNDEDTERRVKKEKACQEINDEYKSDEVATDNDEDTEQQEGNKNKCGTTSATKRKCCILM